jgi:YjbE family integral membrane protein
VGSIAQYFNPALWSDSLQVSINDLGHTEFWIAVLKIIFINFLLSGDNAVVIAMACRGLPHRQRFWGMAIGAGVAVILLIIFTGVIAQLMQLPYLKLIGGLALFYIAAKLLVPESADKDEVEAVAHLWRAVRIVVVADIIMSLDNIIAVAAAAKGNILLLAIGLAVSIPLIIAGAALIMALLDRFPILVWAGAALLGWVAGEVIATDPAVSGYLTAAFGEKLAHQVDWAAAGAGAVLVIAAGGLWRRARLSKAREDAAGEKTGGG